MIHRIRAVLARRSSFVRHSREGGAFNSRKAGHPVLAYCSSIRRQLESSAFAFARHSSASWNPAFSLFCFWSKSFRLSYGRAGHFLVCSDKKVTKETPPRMPRPPRCALRVREAMPGFVERTFMCVQRTRAHRARDLSGISVMPSPRQTGTPRSNAKIKSHVAA